MRPLLVVMVLLGAGVSFAQYTPVTYTLAGAEVVDVLLGMSDQFVEVIMERQSSNHTHAVGAIEVPVSWEYEVDGAPAVYTGVVGLVPGQLWAHLGTYYSAVCLTIVREDCGTWGTGETGTDLDKWAEGPPAYDMQPLFQQSFGDFDNASWLAEPDPDYFLSCNNSYGEYMESLVMAHSFPVGEGVNGVSYWRLSRNYSSPSWSVAKGTQSSVVTATVDALTTFCNSNWPQLRNWKDGRYHTFMGETPAETDTHHGIRLALAEAQAETDRLNAQAGNVGVALIHGVTLTPLPTPEQVGAAPPVIGDPGGGGGDVVVEPGTCEDGWFLTKVVCEIRTQGERLWGFISHDAWVPEVGWQQRSEWLRDDAGQRVPFVWMGDSSGLWVVFQGDSVEDGEFVGTSAATCPRWQVRLQDYMPEIVAPVQGPGSDPAQYQPEINLCENEYAKWMHETGRGWVLAFLYVGVGLWVVRRAIGALGGS